MGPYAKAVPIRPKPGEVSPFSKVSPAPFYAKAVPVRPKPGEVSPNYIVPMVSDGRFSIQLIGSKSCLNSK